MNIGSFTGKNLYKNIVKIVLLSGFASLVLTACDATETSEAPAKTELPVVTVVNEDRAEGEDKEYSPPLDLRVKSDSAFTADGDEDFSSSGKHHNFFDTTAKEESVSVSGKPLIDTTNPDYVDSVQGAEISVDVKIQ
ncbi:MAG: hypothetical protein V7459_13530 [Oceanicoccus sp.]